MQFKLPLLLIATIFIYPIWTKDCTKLKSNTKLFCYYSEIKETGNFCQCTHVVLPEGTELNVVEKIKKQNGDAKILVTVSEFNEKLVSLLKGTQVNGVELNLRKIDSKNDLTDFISTVKSKLGSDHYIAVSVPSKTESLAKHFDFKELSKHADVFVLNTAFLGASQNVTFHPSRLSGLWDMQNTDSMVDLVSGLGAPLSKIVVAAPVQAFTFTLQNEEYTAPGSPATDVKSITRKELCDLMQQKGAEWTLERDQDQAGPYIFRGKQWIAFEDETSIDIKTKYARVRSLAGIAFKDLSQDSETKCGSSLLNAAFKGLSKQARAPRGAVLHTLEREILSPSSKHSSSVHDSPFRISRIIDTQGKIHVVRQDTRTEFECSRQGYFVHPRSCNRFYRCVKFDQRTEEYNVFEFDCPAGLTFDEKTEVCVWPGSLPHASACSGSSEIAPVPQKRFSCPTEPGYYADPENCRWFFACLDHGEPSMQAYEFRCPFGLVFDEEKLLCEWPWLVPRCGLGAAVTLNYYGGVSTNINQYDGLGVLQTVKLGGLQGPIRVAQAKTYSNVGFVGIGDKSLSNPRIFSENSARFIDASRRLGLSLKATQSLYNAGLLSEKLAAIGLTQNDFGLKNLASEVNFGLHQSGQDFSQQSNGFEFGNSRNQLDGEQNQAYQYAGQNLNVVSLGKSQQGGNKNVVLDSGSSSGQQYGLANSNNGQYLAQSNIEQSIQAGVNAGLYNGIYLHSSHGQNEHAQLNVVNSGLNQANIGTEIKYAKNLGPKSYSTSYVNGGQASQGLLVSQKQNIGLGETQNSLLGIGSLTIEDTGSNQATIQGNVQNQQEYNNNLGSNSYSTSYVNVGQTSQSQQGLQKQNIDAGINQQVHLGQGQLTIGNTYLKQSDIGYNNNLGSNSYSTSYVNVGLNSNGQIDLQKQNYDAREQQKVQLGLGQLNIDNTDLDQTNIGGIGNLGGSLQLNLGVGQLENAQGGIGKLDIDYSKINQGSVGEYKTSIGGSLNNRQRNDNLGITGYSNTHINLGQSSEDQLGVLNQNIGQGQEVRIDLAGQNIQTQNINQKNVGLSGYRQNGGILLQNVEINGAAGAYTDDNTQSNLNIGLDSDDFTHVTPASVSHTTASSFESIVSATPLKTIDQYKQKQSIDTSGIEYSINNLQETGPSIRFEQNNGNQAASYQYVQKQQPSFISSTPSSVILQQDSQKLIPIQYNSGPKLSFNVPQIQVVSSTPRPSTQEIFIKSSTSPTTTLQHNSQLTYSQQAPVVSYSSVGEQGIISGQRYSQDGGYRYEKPSIAFEEKPRAVISSTPAYVSEKVSVTPSTATSYSYTNGPSIDLRYQESLKERPQVLLQQPQIVVSSTPSTGSSSSYFRQDTNKVTYQTPQLVQQQPQVTFDQKLISSYNYIKPEISQKPQTLLVQHPLVVSKQPGIVATSYNYINQNQPRITVKQPQVSTSYNYEQPGVKEEIIVEQPRVLLKKPEAVVTSYNYVRPTAQSQILYEQPRLTVKQPEAFVTGYNYVRPTAQSQILYEKPRLTVKQPEAAVTGYNYVRPTVQSQILYEQPRLSVKQPATVVESYNYVKPQVQEEKPVLSQSFSYTQQHARGSYKYEVPRVTVQEQPQVIETGYQKPTVSTSFDIRTGYKYDKPSVVFQEEPKVVQPIVQPVIQNKLLIQKQINQPYVQQQGVTSYQYFQPVVQQPRGFTKETFQEEAVKTYSYSNPVRTQYIVKPATITTNNYRTPVLKSEQTEFKGYGYPKPEVQFFEEPKPVITNYEGRVPVVETPIVPKKAYVLGNSFQYHKRIPTIQVLKDQTLYTTPRPTFISTINSLVAQKASPVPQREFIYYDSRLDNNRQNQYTQASTVKPSEIPTISYRPSISQNVNIEGYRYLKPTIQFEDGPRTSEQEIYQYQVTKQRPIQVQPQIVRYSTPRPSFVSTIKSIVGQKFEPLRNQFITTPPTQIQYLESTTSRPISTVRTSYLPAAEHKIQNVEINGYVDQKPQIQSYQYTQQTTPQTQVIVEDFVNQKYDRPAYYTTERPVIAQKLTPVAQEYFYYDSRLTSTQAPDVQYVQKSTRGPIVQKTQRVEFEGYNYPKPEVSFEEPKTVITSYENKVPVVEAPIVPKKAYVTTGQSYTYNQNVKIEQQSAKPIVLENYVATNNRESSNVELGQIDYVTPRPTYSSTVASVIHQKSLPIQPEFTYIDSRYSNTPRTRLNSQKVRVQSERGYSYPKPKVQLLEEPQQVLNTVQVTKEAQPIILENYVSPAYQKFDVSYQSSTPATVLSQNIRQNVVQYDRISRLPSVKVTQAPLQLNLELSTPATVIKKLEQEQPIESFFNYGSRLSTLSPKIEVVQEKEEVPEVYHQEVTSYDSRYSARPAVQVKSRPSITIIEQEQPAQEITLGEQYSLEASTEGQRVQYVDIAEKEPASTYLPIRKRVKVTKPSRKYLPTSTVPSLEYLPSSTPATVSNEYLPVSSSQAPSEGDISVENYENFELVRKNSRPQSIRYVEIADKEPSSTYLPTRKRVEASKPSRIYLPTSTIPSVDYLPSSTLETVSNEYLPVSSSQVPSEGDVSVENYENFELVRKKSRPVKVVKIVRPRVKTVVVKKNDFNPFLSAKLGAQCTCTSNTIELRKEPLRIEVADDDEYENDDDIIKDHNDGEAIVVESYESGKIDAVTDEPLVYIKSSTVETPSSTYRLRKVNRGRVRVKTVVGDVSSRRKPSVNVEAADVNIVASRVKVNTRKIDIVADDAAEVNVEAGVFRSNVVGIESGENIEINSRNFDRYGPGGLRSATETLQGIDCQRAGLFRHPTQCNKFYSCRWDCKKNKFTLHVFNCPVHLTFDNNLGACNWPSQGPACLENTLLPSE